MVKGLEIFKEYFSKFTEQYVLIGGTACDLLMNQAGLRFRATKDLDIVLCIDNLNYDYVLRLWDFIRDGGYEIRERAQDKKRCFYRFAKPADARYPAMIELFSRKPDGLDPSRIGIITPITVGGEIVSLSAILLDDDYYAFINSDKAVISEISIVSVACLISLKAKAWMDLCERKNAGESIDEVNITKHKKDVFRLSQIIETKPLNDVPASLKSDLDRFLTQMEDEEIDLPQLGITRTTKNEILQGLRHIYSLA